MTRDEFIERLDDVALVFGDTRDTLWLLLDNETPPVMEWSLMDMVGETLDVARTESEREDVRQIASHFEYLAGLIRKTLDEDEAKQL